MHQRFCSPSRLQTFTPFPKNPDIARFFRQIGLADELGSGVRNMMKYGKAYGDDDPELIEGDVFRIIVKVPEFEETGRGHRVSHQGKQVTAQVNAQVNAQVVSFCRDPKSAREIMTELGLKHWKTFQDNYLDPLMDTDILERTIPDKPKSRLQKYRLSAGGQQILKNLP